MTLFGHSINNEHRDWTDIMNSLGGGVIFLSVATIAFGEVPCAVAKNNPH